MIADALLQQVALGILPPAGLAVATLGAALVWRRRRAAAVASDAPAAVALGGGLLVALACLSGWPSVPPHDGTEGAILATTAAALAAVVDRHLRLPRAAWAGLVFAGAAGTAWLVLRRMAEHWPAGQTAAHAAAGGVVVLALALVLRANARHDRLLAPAQLTLVAAGCGQVLASGSALLGQLAGALAAVGALVVAAFALDRGQRLARGATATAAVALGALMLCAYEFAEVPPAPLLLVVAAAAMGLLARPLHSSPGWIRWLIVLGATGALLSAAALAIPAAPYADYGY